MRLRPVVSRVAAVVPLVLLTACVVTGSGENAGDSAAEGFLEFILILFIVALIGAIVWGLILAGGVAAILAGIRRVKNPPPPPQQPVDPATQAGQAPPLPGTGAGEPPPPIPTGTERKQPDVFGIALIVFGAVLVVTAGPFLFGDNGFGTNVRIPLPLLIVAGVLVVFGLRRRRD